MGIGIGYVLFADADYVTEAVALNGTKFLNREIRVRGCRKNASRSLTEVPNEEQCKPCDEEE